MSKSEAAPAAVVNPDMRLNMVNFKTPDLADLEIKSMKKFILEYK